MPMPTSPHPAVIFCEGAFRTSVAKTAHALLRSSKRFEIVAIMDSTCQGEDAGAVIGIPNCDIPIVAELEQALVEGRKTGRPLSHFIIGLSGGGYLSLDTVTAIREAMASGLNIVSGLPEFLSDIPELSRTARHYGVTIRDIRKTPPVTELHQYSGEIEKVTSLIIGVFGTDKVIGKSTTAHLLAIALNEAGITTELVGTSQYTWLQGVRYGLILETLPHEAITGELEHAVLSAYRERNPEVILIEGPGGLTSPAYPGGMEVLSAIRPQLVLLQHAAGRKDYDGCAGRAILPLANMVRGMELLSAATVFAVTLNMEGLPELERPRVLSATERDLNVPVLDILGQGTSKLVELIKGRLDARKGRG